MINLSFWILLAVFLTISSARGPHHPRGAAVVKRHVHYTPTNLNEIKLTQNENLLHDKEHLQEHLDDDKATNEVDLNKMSDTEIELYYFLLHDSDKNSKLDGLELLNAILHTTHHQQFQNTDQDLDDDQASNNIHNIHISEESFRNFVELVDQVLNEDDKNQDGFLDYAEYVDGRKRAEGIEKKSAKMFK